MSDLTARRTESYNIPSEYGEMVRDGLDEIYDLRARMEELKEQVKQRGKWMQDGFQRSNEASRRSIRLYEDLKLEKDAELAKCREAWQRLEDEQQRIIDDNHKCFTAGDKHCAQGRLNDLRPARPHP